MTKKTVEEQSKITKSGAVEIEEGALDDVQGGVFTGYLKIPDIDGESQLTTDTYKDKIISSVDPKKTLKW